MPLWRRRARGPRRQDAWGKPFRAEITACLAAAEMTYACRLLRRVMPRFGESASPIQGLKTASRPVGRMRGTGIASCLAGRTQEAYRLAECVWTFRTSCRLSC
jgi:hypothetical protein